MTATATKRPTDEDLREEANRLRDEYLEHRRQEPPIPMTGPVTDEDLETWRRWRCRQEELRQSIERIDRDLQARTLRAAGIW